MVKRKWCQRCGVEIQPTKNRKYCEECARLADEESRKRSAANRVKVRDKDMRLDEVAAMANKKGITYGELQKQETLKLMGSIRRK